MALQHLRSSTANKRPLPAGMSDGQLAINTNNTSPGLFFKDSAGALVKVGPVHVGTTAPNASPASGGETGNTVGEQWLDTTGGTYVFKVWDGSAWRSESGTFVDVNGDTMTGALGIIAGTAAAPGLYFSGDTDTGIYSPAANELAISTNSTQRLLIDSTGNISLGSLGGAAGVTNLRGSSYHQFVVANDLYVDTTPSGGQIIFRRNAGASESMRIDGSGRLGVGTSTVSDKLHVDAGNITLSYNGGSTGLKNKLSWRTESPYFDEQAYIAANRTAVAGAPTDLIFATSASAGAATEKLRITSAGLVGIGTSAPSTLFHCAGTARFGANDATDIELQIGAGATGNRAAYIDFVGDTTYSDYGLRIIRNGTGANTNSLFAHRGTGDLQLNALEAGAIGLFTNDTQRLRITSAGLVGIGTTSPANGSVNIIADSSANSLNLNCRSANDVSYIRFSNNSGSEVLGYIGIARTGANAGALLFENSGSERARIDSSGRLLVGTSSYSFAATAVLQGNSSASNEDAVFRMNRGGTPGASADLGVITFGDNAGNVGASIRATNDTASSWGSGDYPGRLTFSVSQDGSASPTERQRINSAGAALFFSSADGIRSAVSASAGTSTAVFWGRHSATSTSNGTDSFFVWSNGNVVNTNNSYGAISDIKLKENIVDAGSQWNDLKALQVRKYNFKEGQTHTQIGLVAQEVELVSPGLVTESPDRDAEGNDLGTVTKSVNYSVLYMKAVKALQEAMERIETLEAKVAALESA